MARNNSGYYRGARQRVRKREKRMAKRQFKAKRKLGGGRKQFRKWDEWNEGDILIAKLADTYEDQYGKTVWVMAVVDAQFKDGSGDKYIGKDLALNSCGMLDKAMKRASLGTMVQITYDGQSTIEKGKFAGKESHVVQVDEVEEDIDNGGDGYQEEYDEEEVDL